MDHLSQQDLNILLVEPSPTQRRIIVQELLCENVTAVDQANSIATALSSIQSVHPDLVASALYLEDGTAMDLFRMLRTSEDCRDTPFMLVSSERRHEQLDQFKQAGVVAILPKPFTRDHLRRALRATVDLLSPEELNSDAFDIENLRVLSVDDSLMARKMVRKVVTNLGITDVTEAKDGAEAQQLLSDKEFDLIITDYNMPNMDGAELASFVRSTPEYSHIPIMMVTSEQDEAKLGYVSQCGVDAIIDKPFSPEEVRRLLQKVMEG
ncbi:MAG: response regulator [Pontibacterium sp.]